MTIASEFKPRKRPLSMERVQQIRREREARGLVTPAPPPAKTAWQLLKEADAEIARQRRREEAEEAQEAAVRAAFGKKDDDGVILLRRRVSEMREAMRKAIPEPPPVKRPSIKEIQIIVAGEFGITRADILSPNRKARCVVARHVAMWIARQTTKLSLPEIGRRFGGRDHTTALNAIRKIEALRERDQHWREHIDAIMERVREG